MILAGIYRSTEVGFCWSDRLVTFCIFSCDSTHKVALIVKFIALLVILDDLVIIDDLDVLFWVQLPIIFQIFGMFFIFKI